MNPSTIIGTKSQESTIKKLTTQLASTDNVNRVTELVNQIRDIQNNISLTAGRQLGYHQGIQLSYAFD